MTGLQFVLAMAWRESRASVRRLSLLMGAMAVGVSALVAINSFTAGLQASVRQQAQAILGADLALGSGRPIEGTAEEKLRELVETSGATLARRTSLGAMAYVPSGSGARLVQLSAIEAGFPFYGAIETAPPGEWARLQEDRLAVVDPALLSALGAEVGDTLAIGEGRFRIGGVVLNVPGDVGVRSAFGPRVFVAARWLDETGLLGFGSRARYEALLKLPPGSDPQRLSRRYRSAFARERVTLRTVDDDQRRLNDNLGQLGRYLGLVALVAVLLGGLGVASAVHVFIKRKIETVAVLRCLGASGGRVMAVYLVQAVAMGLGGSLAGVALGAALQAVLPRVLADFLPVDVSFSVSAVSLVVGVVVGIWIAGIFSLVPLLAVRHVSPLVVLRRPYDETESSRKDPWRVVAVAALAASVVLLSLLQAGSPGAGLAFAGAIGVTLGALWLASMALIRTLRRRFPQRLPYLFRQGLANLYRPANQTVTVVLALGFGAFLLGTILLVQHNLLRDLRVDGAREQANLVLFDIQPDQRASVEDEVRRAGLLPSAAVPIVPMRIQSVKGVPTASVLGAPRTEGDDEPPGRWAFRREYRSTYRDELVGSERIVAGRPWAKGSGRQPAAAASPVPISIEEDVAEELRVGLGDEIVWDVQGLALTSRVAAIREVDWARFEPNFFVVFPEGPLDDAPQTFVTLTRAADAALRARLQRQVIERFPNVTAVDLAQVQQAIEAIVSRVSLAIRFMALFSLATGAIVLVGTVATSRYQRVREGALLKTLGATRGQVLRILFAEYLCLGALASSTALVLSSAAGWALVRFVFESRFTLPLAGLCALGASVVVLTVAVGLWSSTEVLRRPPLEVLRAE